MKISTLAASFGILATSVVANNVFASDLNMDVITYGNSARVTVTDNGQNVQNMPVTVTNGSTAYVVKTSANGSILVSNQDDVNQTYTFAVADNSGSKIETTRLLGH